MVNRMIQNDGGSTIDQPEFRHQQDHRLNQQRQPQQLNLRHQLTTMFHLSQMLLQQQHHRLKLNQLAVKMHKTSWP
jgi:hypothetical protein